MKWEKFNRHGKPSSLSVEVCLPVCDDLGSVGPGWIHRSILTYFCSPIRGPPLSLNPTSDSPLWLRALSFSSELSAQDLLFQQAFPEAVGGRTSSLQSKSQHGGYKYTLCLTVRAISAIISPTWL